MVCHPVYNKINKYVFFICIISSLIIILRMMKAMIHTNEDMRIIAIPNSSSFTVVSNLESRMQQRQIVDPPALALAFPQPLEPDNWQTVIPGKVFVYSAHLDPWSKNDSIIHILGSITKEELVNKTELYCKIWMVRDDGKSVVVDLSKVTEITDLDQKWKAYQVRSAEFTCHFNQTPDVLANVVVQLTNSPQVDASNAMNLHQNFKQGQCYNFTVCLEGPLHGRISTDLFVEWMEANLLFGADIVLIHNLSTHAYLESYINYYKSTGTLQIIPWDLDILLISKGQNNTIRQNLQATMILDCQYRLQQYSKYIVFIDLDELIVPRLPTDKTWSDMIEHLQCPLHPHSYGARQLWFIKGFPRVDNTSLITQDARIRHVFIADYGVRSKYIADTTKLRTKAYVHSVIKRNGNSTCVMPPHIGALHHYRGGQVRNTENDTIEDDTMVKYKTELMQRFKHVTEKVSRSTYQFKQTNE